MVDCAYGFHFSALIQWGPMQKFLLTCDGRVTRSQIWLSLLYYMAAGLAAGLIMVALWQVIPGKVGADGGYHVEGPKAVPYVLVGFGTFAFLIWSGVCVAIKRYHDRDKSGWWILIQLVPIVGPIWYFIEVFCLRGAPGDNRFGPDPLAATAPQQSAT
jgi:uncharacterized membrane protein YhaH (DUF805 family)